METIYKKQYVTPELEIVILDNEISLALESNPPNGPDEITWSNSVSQIDPFKMNV